MEGAPRGPSVTGGVPAFPLGPLPFGVVAPPELDCWASVDVTVVLDTCREPDDRRPLDEPVTEWENMSCGLNICDGLKKQRLSNRMRNRNHAIYEKSCSKK